MSAALQFAVDALRVHQPFVEGGDKTLCCCEQGGWLTWTEHRKHVAAAVVAAVRGPIRAEAQLDTIAEAIRFLDATGGTADTLREWFHDLRSTREVTA